MSAKRNAATTGQPDLGDNQEGGDGERHPAPGVPFSGSSRRQAALPVTEFSVPADPLQSWQDRANAIAAWLPTATREALMAFAWRHFQRAESAAWCIAEEHRRDRLLAQREASLAISAAVDWTAASKRPSFAELTRRRVVVD